jgi:glycosyltransferase involved in cell wall biosynthesis
MPVIVCTVTNDLIYDQRMQRICTTLADAGYEVKLVGRMLPTSTIAGTKPYSQVRLFCYFRKGFLFYAEFNIRLCIWLLFHPFDAVCSVDLDTLPAGCLASLIKGKKRVFDAHEYFTEVPELVGRPITQAFWKLVAGSCLPFYKTAYTVGPGLASIFEKMYGIHFEVVRNVPFLQGTIPVDSEGRTTPKIVLYQGALNAGRGIEAMLSAMRELEDVELWLAGEGDLSEQLRKMAVNYGLSEKVRFLGYVLPSELPALTRRAWIGLNLLENKGLSYYYSLANKFFDCIQSGIPVLTMNFPEYRALQAQYETAVLLDEANPTEISFAINDLKKHPERYATLKQNCRQAALVWNWEQEKTTLLKSWAKVLPVNRARQ